MLYRGLGTLQSSKNNNLSGLRRRNESVKGHGPLGRITLERWCPGTGEMAQCLRAVVACAQDLGLIPTWWFTMSKSKF